MRKSPGILLIFIFIFNNAFAQEMVSKTEEPFFNTDYCAATLYSDSHIYQGLKIKINFVTNEVRFIKENSDEIEMTISFRIKKIEFGSCGGKSKAVFQSGFPIITSREDRDILYQVLDSGKVSLLKNTKVTEKEGAKNYYGKSEMIYQKYENYYAYTAATKSLVTIERSKQGLLKILEDKKEAVDKFITENNIRFREEAELIKVITFYNSL